MNNAQLRCEAMEVCEHLASSWNEHVPRSNSAVEMTVRVVSLKIRRDRTYMIPVPGSRAGGGHGTPQYSGFEGVPTIDDVMMMPLMSLLLQ